MWRHVILDFWHPLISIWSRGVDVFLLPSHSWFILLKTSLLDNRLGHAWESLQPFNMSGAAIIRELFPRYCRGPRQTRGEYCQFCYVASETDHISLKEHQMLGNQQSLCENSEVTLRSWFVRSKALRSVSILINKCQINSYYFLLTIWQKWPPNLWWTYTCFFIIVPSPE